MGGAPRRDDRRDGRGNRGRWSVSDRRRRRAAAGRPDRASMAGLGGTYAGAWARRSRATRPRLAEPRYTSFALLAAAIREMENQVGIRTQAIAPGELESWNTPALMLAGRQLGLPVADGDYAGRAAGLIGERVSRSRCGTHGRARRPRTGQLAWTSSTPTAAVALRRVDRVLRQSEPVLLRSADPPGAELQSTLYAWRPRRPSDALGDRARPG